MKRQIVGLSIAIISFTVGSTVSYGQVRDAASKALGEYAHGAPNGFAARNYSRGIVPANQPSVVARSGQSSEGRAFSLDANRPASGADATSAAPAPPSTARSAPAQAQRRFSYEPGMMGTRPTYSAPRGWQSGVRDATSKARSEY